MKKAISLLLAMIVILSLAASSFADGSSVPAIPTFPSAKEVDIDAVLSGNRLGSLLNRFGNIEMRYTLDQEQPQGRYSFDYVDTYYLIDGSYYMYTIVNDKVYGGTTESFYEYDPDNSYIYYRFPGGPDKQEYPAEYFAASLDWPVVPYAGSHGTTEVISAEEAGGLYVLTYVCRYPDGAMDGPVTLYVDPASSLIAAYKFSGSADNAFGHVNYVYDARLEYGVDTVPNYSIRDEAA